MTDAPIKTQIRALFEAVEAGGADDFALFYCLGHDGVMKPLMLYTTRASAAWQAYRGSLDAALALHEALFPWWGLVVNCGKNYASVRADKDMHLSDESFFHAESISPSRAALLAILKAYEAQQ